MLCYVHTKQMKCVMILLCKCYCKLFKISTLHAARSPCKCRLKLLHNNKKLAICDMHSIVLLLIAQLINRLMSYFLLHQCTYGQVQRYNNNSHVIGGDNMSLHFFRMQSMKRMLLPLLAYANNETYQYGLSLPYNLAWVS